MMWMLRQCVYVTIIGIALLGCQQGVTDVGNPNIADKPSQASPAPVVAGSGVPAFGQLVGGYSSTSAVAASTDPNSPSAMAVSVCQSDSTTPHSISLGANPTDIILTNFFSYGPETDQIHAVYNTGTGAISFEVDGSNVVMNCSGNAALASGNVTVSLTCHLTQPQEGNCISLTIKKS